jgi:hypothetical protein
MRCWRVGRGTRDATGQQCQEARRPKRLQAAEADGGSEAERLRRAQQHRQRGLDADQTRIGAA